VWLLEPASGAIACISKTREKNQGRSEREREEAVRWREEERREEEDRG
jgi:hypothetical protein